jgi:hypothetical protein
MALTAQNFWSHVKHRFLRDRFMLKKSGCAEIRDFHGPAIIYQTVGRIQMSMNMK